MDILLPGSLERRYEKSVRPVLETTGVEAPKLLRDLVRHEEEEPLVWALRVRRPLPGSVLIPDRLGNNYRAADVLVRFKRGSERDSSDDPATIDRVFGVSAQASAAKPGAPVELNWEEHPVLAVSVGFVTLLAEILPGKDVFVATEVWASVVAPLAILRSKPMDASSRRRCDFKQLGEEIDLCRKCGKCEGTGAVDCHPCEGRGRFVCDRCGGTGRCRKCGGDGGWDCKKCDGRGRIDCRKCNGSGDFIGKFGDRMGDCRVCSGDGYLTCNRCHGHGRDECHSCEGSGDCWACDGAGQTTCQKCDGSGSLGCSLCDGTGVLTVAFLQQSGGYRCKGKKVSAAQVSAIENGSLEEYELNRGAGDDLQDLLFKADQDAELRRRIRETQDDLERIDECLEHSMEAAGVSREIREFRPAGLGRPTPSTVRRKGRQILAFPLLKHKGWAKRGENPFPVGTPLCLFERAGTGRGGVGKEIEIDGLVDNPAQRTFSISFEGLDTNGAQSQFLISFPNGVDPARFPESMYVKPDLIPPAELVQQRELATWCRHGESPQQLRAFVPQEGREDACSSKLDAIDPGIRTNPHQAEAVKMMVSDQPLVLVKGPPGTGKTTVITEVVLQSIQRGEKVLICSETHQAVCNVLEKLHGKGNIRMVRHARSDNAKLSKLEVQYLEGGARSGFFSRIRDKVEANRKREAELREMLSPIPEAIQAAVTASSEFEKRERAANKKLARAEESCEKTIASADRGEDEELQRLLRESEEYAASWAGERNAIEVESAEATRKLDKVQRRMRKISGILEKKHGKAAEWSTQQAKGLKRMVDWVIPDSVASEAELQQRWSRLFDEGKAHESTVAECRDAIEKGEAGLAEFEQRSRQESEKCTSQARRKREKAREKLAKVRSEQEEEVAAAEKESWPAQETAAGLWNRVRNFSESPQHDISQAWMNRADQADSEIQANKERANLLDRWVSALETATSELTLLFWETNQVFLSTCVGLGSWRSFHQHFGRRGVDLVVIDEAAHATLTQALIPMRCGRRIALVGDEMQLPPSPPMELQCAKCCTAREPVYGDPPSPDQRFKPPMSSCWLERSAFEWLSETRPNLPRVMLSRQFRMHPDIADFVGEIFYEGELENGVSKGDRDIAFAEFGRAVCLIPTSGYKDRFEERSGTSYTNPLEARLTARVLRHAVEGLAESCHFGVVTPYSAQRDLITRELADFFVTGRNVRISADDIASVDSFQGSERDVMIASFVRSPKNRPKKCSRCKGRGRAKGGACSRCQGRGVVGPRLDWVHDLRRLNVAFSRARKMLILIGDVEALTDPLLGTGEGSEVLDRFSEHVRDRGQVLHVWEEQESHV